MLLKLLGFQTGQSPAASLPTPSKAWGTPPLASTTPMTTSSLTPRDIYFSDQSTRALVSRFIHQRKPKDPLFFTFSPPHQALPIWDFLAKPSQDVILSAVTKGAVPKVSPLLSKTPAPAEGETASTSEAPTPVKPAVKRVPQVTVYHLKGQFMPSESHQALSSAFKKLGKATHTPSWVAQDKQGQWTLLETKDSPTSLGYMRHQHPLKERVHLIVGNILSGWFQIPQTPQGWNLPNGAIWEAHPGHWTDPAGQPANLKQVVKTPDGRWFDVQQIASQRTLLFSNKKQLSLSITNLVAPLESQGAVREYPALLNLWAPNGTVSGLKVAPFSATPAQPPAPTELSLPTPQNLSASGALKPGDTNPFAQSTPAAKPRQTFTGMAANTPQEKPKLEP